MWIPPFLGDSDLTYQPESESSDFISVAFAWNYQVLRLYHSRVMTENIGYLIYLAQIIIDTLWQCDRHFVWERQCSVGTRRISILMKNSIPRSNSKSHLTSQASRGQSMRRIVDVSPSSAAPHERKYFAHITQTAMATGKIH